MDRNYSQLLMIHSLLYHFKHLSQQAGVSSVAWHSQHPLSDECLADALPTITSCTLAPSKTTVHTPTTTV
jgi:hypothetical protein